MLTINNTLDGYLKDVEILGNTIQDEGDLADIRSVGDKIEGQELYETPVLSCGKNLFNPLNNNIECALHSGTHTKVTYKIEGGKIIIKSNPSVNSDWGWVEFKNIKVTPNKSYTIHPNATVIKGNACVFVYDGNNTKLFEIPNVSKTFIPTTKHISVRLYVQTTTLYTDAEIHYKIQLEEGTQATPYEPYVEDKLTILSPTQLEKVGDVADRLIEKDGVWGVEKNVVTYHLKDFTQSNYNNFACRTVFPKFGAVFDGLTTTPFYTNLGYMHTDINYQWNNRGINSIAVNRAMINDQYKYVCDITSETYVYNDVVKMIKDNDIWVKYALLEPQFIPLPHSQQVKLRTFANKTNISFGCEIEGAIKAQVPKSLGATVNTHTEQIRSLNNELNRVKKLEESTVSTVATESDFTTVEATSNGYFEDVKLEGKTLVVNANNEVVEPGTEGATLKSVGDGVDEIVVSSVNENLLHNDNFVLGNINDNGVFVIANDTIVDDEFYSIIPNVDYTFKSYGQINNQAVTVNRIVLYDKDYNFLSRVSISMASEVTFNITDIKAKYVKFIYRNPTLTNIDLTQFKDSIKLQLNIGDVAKNFVKGKSDKKRLLYYNDETQAWEKPILRQWDSIEKHANGKYYYHQRSAEVVLNGSEEWVQPGWSKTEDWLSRNPNGFAYETVISILGKASDIPIICDKFNSKSISNSAGLSIGHCTLFEKYLSFATTAQSTIEQWKSELQTNPVTVVYQLAEEKVYECTNIDLITYANETNYIVESGAIVPRTTLKVHNNISNVVKILQEKVSLLENKFIEGLKKVLAGDMYSLAELLYPEDFVEENPENNIMLLPFE